MKQYILNKETGKIQLEFTKAEYQALSESDKKELKSAYLFSGQLKAWVSRSKNNHYSAIRVAEKLGFSNGGSIGQRLSYAEELERKAEKAEARAERYEQYAENAERRAENLQKEFNKLRKDWSWLTQPIIKGHSGSERFGRQRQKVMDRYNKGFEEYRKSEYFRNRADVAKVTASKMQLQNRTYLSNRIEESNKRIRELERAIIRAENNNNNNNEQWIENLLEKMEYEIDKLAFFQNALDEIGGIQYNKDNLKVGYLVKIRESWYTVVKANPKTVEVKSSAVPYTLKYSYVEIQEIKIPEGWTESKNEVIENPFQVGDVVAQIFHRGEKFENLVKAFQVVKVTSKSVNIQQIKIENGKPIKDSFISNEQLQRRIGKDRNGENVVNYDNYNLFKYVEDGVLEVV